MTVNEDATMRGDACLVSRRHIVELHDLSDPEAAAFMRDIRRLSAAVQAVTGAVKMNYGVHGNTSRIFTCTSSRGIAVIPLRVGLSMQRSSGGRSTRPANSRRCGHACWKRYVVRRRPDSGLERTAGSHSLAAAHGERRAKAA